MPRWAVLLWLPMGDLRPPGIGVSSAESQRRYVSAFAPLSQQNLPGWQERWVIWTLGQKLRRHGDAELRAMSAVYLYGVHRAGGRIDRAKGALLRAIDDPDPTVERCAAMALVDAFGDDRSLEQLWVRLLREGREDTTRGMAAWPLGQRCQAGDLSYLPALIAAMKSELADPQVQQGTAIGAIADAVAYSRSEEALAAFLPLLESADPFERFVAGQSIATMGEVAAPAVPALIRNIRANSSLNSIIFIRALAAIGPAAREAVPLLIEGIGHPQEAYGLRCMHALGRLGRGDARASEALVEQLSSTRYGYRRGAIEALAKLGWAGGAVERERIEALARDEDAGLWIWAKLILARMDGEIEGFVREMVEIVRADSLAIWDIEEAIEALGELGTKAAAAAPLLKELCPAPERGRPLSDDAMRKREAAVAALRLISPEDARGD